MVVVDSINSIELLRNERKRRKESCGDDKLYFVT